ncbi:MADS-box transcription factor, partial [Asimina triloba]
ERQLGEVNKQLKTKLEAEGLDALKAIQGTWEGEGEAVDGNDGFPMHSLEATPIECEPTLQIG